MCILLETAKHCFSCGEDKPPLEFGKDRSRGDGLQARCRLCDKAYKAERRAANPERHRAHSRRHRANDPEAYNEKVRATYQRNLERERERCRLKRARQNPFLVRARKLNHRGKLVGAAGRVTAEGLQAKLEYQGGRCRWCGNLLTAFHFDHIIPLSLGGPNHLANLCATCPRCNKSKGERRPSEWPQKP